MKLSIGLDSTDIERFIHWHTYPLSMLRTIFSHDEIAYALDNPCKSAERFALRFAAKEAALKALSQWFPDHKFLLRPTAQAMCLIKQKTGMLTLAINWPQLNIVLSTAPTSITIAVTHTKTAATAVVIFLSQ